jgi:hypothetical protein
MGIYLNKKIEVKNYGWECDVTGGACMYLYPNSKQCAKYFNEGSDADYSDDEVAKVNDITNVTVKELEQLKKQALDFGDKFREMAEGCHREDNF